MEFRTGFVPGRPAPDLKVWVDGIFIQGMLNLKAEFGLVNKNNRYPKYIQMLAVLEAGGGYFDGKIISFEEPLKTPKRPRIRTERGSGPLLRRLIKHRLGTYNA